MALQIENENLKSTRGTVGFTLVDPNCIIHAYEGPAVGPIVSTFDVVAPQTSETVSTSTEAEALSPKKPRRPRKGLKELSLNLTVATDAYGANNKAIADAVLAITLPALRHDALLRRVNDALSEVDDEGIVDIAGRCLVLGILDGTPPCSATPALLANAVAASSWLEVTTNEVRATLVARAAAVASKDPVGVEAGLKEELRTLAFRDPALAHVIVQDEYVIDTLRDMTTSLRDNPSNPGADANRHLSYLLYDLGLARQGSSPAKTIEAARMMVRRGLRRIDRICGGLFASGKHRLYDRLAFESP